MKLQIVIVLLLAVCSTLAQDNSTARDQLKQYVAELQKHPDDQTLREKIIKLVLTLDPKPAIPEEARKHFVMATTMQKAAKDSSAYSSALEEYRQALLISPWWGDAYYNEAVALESLKQFDEASAALKLYLLTNPSDKESREAQDRIYALEAHQKLAASERAEQSSVAELTFWNSIKDSTNVDDFRAYLEKYPNGDFAPLARNRLAPLEAAEREKQKERERQEQITRRTKSFNVAFGIWETGTAVFYHVGKLIISPTGIQFLYDDDDKKANLYHWFDDGRWKEDFPCSYLGEAKLDGDYIREVYWLADDHKGHQNLRKSRFQAATSQKRQALWNG